MYAFLFDDFELNGKGTNFIMHEIIQMCSFERNNINENVIAHVGINLSSHILISLHYKGVKLSHKSTDKILYIDTIGLYEIYLNRDLLPNQVMICSKKEYLKSERKEKLKSLKEKKLTILK